MANRRAFRGVATGLTVLLLTGACASRAPRPAIAPSPTAVEAVPPGQVSAGLAVGAEARIEDSRHPRAPRVISVRVHVENRGVRPVSLRRSQMVLEGDGGTVRAPEEPGSLAGPKPPASAGSGRRLGGIESLVAIPLLGIFLAPAILVVGGAVAMADLAAGREQRLHAENVRAYETRSFPGWTTLEPGQTAIGFVFFAPAAGGRAPAAAPLGVQIEDLWLAGDPDDDRAEEASPVLRSVRVRLRDRSVVQAGAPE